MVCSPEQEKVGTGSIEAIIYPVYSDLRIRATVSQVLHNPSETNVGAWFLCGFIDEFTTDDTPVKKYDKIKGFRAKCILAQDIYKSYYTNEYDYFEFEVPYQDNNFPKSY
jgi:hypothetical protein